MDTTSIEHLANNDGYDLEMFVSFSLDSFQNVLSFSKCRDGDNFFKGARITKPLLYSTNMLPNCSAFLSLDGISYKWRLPIDADA